MRDELQKARLAYAPSLPLILRDLKKIVWEKSATEEKRDGKVKTLFPLTCAFPHLLGKKGGERSLKPLKVGVVFSGGPAAGGHNVITGLYDSLKALHPDSHLLGFLDGPAGIISGKSKELTAEAVASYRNQGGFDMIGSGRTKIETQEQLGAAAAVALSMQLDGLVIVGGDDSNTNAAVLAEFFLKSGCATKVIGVPKTIDGDLKNAHVALSFGFDTACKVYAEMISNICRDAASARKYTHFIKLMGRSASHIALECALATHPNLTLIGEEVAAKKLTLRQITSEIADLICRRTEKGKSFGVILIPEGLIEFIPEMGLLIGELNALLAENPTPSLSQVLPKLTPASQSSFSALPERIQQQLLLHRDPHGNVQVSLIETERLLIETVASELDERQKKGAYRGKFYPMHHFLGYEGRAGFPSNFDANYCYALGHTATLLIDAGATGMMCAITGLTQPAEEWGIGAVPLTSLMHIETRQGKEKPVIRKALVDLQGKPFAFLKQHEEKWKFDDDYCFPGPIQFCGGPHLSDTVPLSLALETKKI